MTDKMANSNTNDEQDYKLYRSKYDKTTDKMANSNTKDEQDYKLHMVKIW